jgi:integrase
MSQSTARSRRRKANRPKKPYPEFPLSPHPSGKWQKKIRGSTYYFGRWANRANGKLVRVEGDGWQETLELYKSRADDLHAGRTPRVKNPDGLTVATLCNRFLTAKLRKKESGELTDQTFADYKIITDLIVATFGTERLVDDLAADDFARLRSVMAKRWGPERLGNSIVRIRSVFRYGIENGLIEKPIRYGSEFKKPGQSVLRRNKAAKGERMLESEQLRRLLDALDGKEVETERTDDAGEPVKVKLTPNPQLRAIVLLGLNAALGNTDCAALARATINLQTAWLNFPRPKTGIPRRCPLWPETVAAIKDALQHRPEPASDECRELVFLTPAGKLGTRRRLPARLHRCAIR